MKEFNPTLSSDRLILRPYSKSDRNQIMVIRSDEASNASLHRKPPQSFEDVDKHIEMIVQGVANKKWYNWGLVLPGSNEIIGIICLWNVDFSKNYAEIGYELVTDHKRKGIMSQAISMVLDFCLKQTNFIKIGAFARIDNTASNSILIKHGFKLGQSENKGPEENYYELDLVR